jgi:hypothetical protein
VTDTFTTLASAQAFFNDHAISLGSLSGSVTLTETLTVTETAAGGVGISYVVADPKVASAPLTSPAILAFASTSPMGVFTDTNQRPELLAILWKFDSADGNANKRRTAQLMRIPAFSPLLKGPHRELV